jgi:hypothetical protein
MKTLNQYIEEKLVLTSKSKIRKQQYTIKTDYRGDMDALENAIAFLWPKSKIEVKVDDFNKFVVEFLGGSFEDLIRICAVICDLWRDGNGNPASIKGDFNNDEDLACLLGEEKFSLVSKHVDLIEKELEHIHTTLSDPNNKEWEKEFYQ